MTALALLSQPVPLEPGGLSAEVGVGRGVAWIMELLSLLNKIEKESVTVSILVTSSGPAIGQLPPVDCKMLFEEIRD